MFVSDCEPADLHELQATDTPITKNMIERNSFMTAMMPRSASQYHRREWVDLLEAPRAVMQ